MKTARWAAEIRGYDDQPNHGQQNHDAYEEEGDGDSDRGERRGAPGVGERLEEGREEEKVAEVDIKQGERKEVKGKGQRKRRQRKSNGRKGTTWPE